MAFSNKFALFVILPSIEDFLQEKGREGVKDLVELRQYLQDKTGIDIQIDWLEKFLNSILDNSEMFMVMLVSEYADILAEGSLNILTGSAKRIKSSAMGIFNFVGGLL